MSVKLSTVYNIILAIFIVATIYLWWVLLQSIWAFVPQAGGPAFSPNKDMLLIAGGALTTLGTATAASLGFSVADFKFKKLQGAHPGLTDTARVVGLPVLLAVLAYVAISCAVGWAALSTPAGQSVDVLKTYLASLVGWFLGAVPTALKAPS